MESIYIDVDGEPMFARFHGADPAVDTGIGVLMCPPWGWEEVASHRARRRWAEEMAVDGFSVLRIDLLGTGDSGGTGIDGDQLPPWVRSIHAGVRWLHALPNVRRVTALGMGLGGSLALLAIGDGAPVDDLVLWAAHSRGRRFVRAQRAFAGAQLDYLLPIEPEPTSLPSDWLEVHGFVINSATLPSLSGVDTRALSTGRLRRALLIEQDGIPVDASLADHLKSSGVDVSVSPGPGWAEMTDRPQVSVFPTRVVEAVRVWLEATPVCTREVGGTNPVERSSSASVAHVDVGGITIEEQASIIGMPGGSLFGVSAEPEVIGKSAPVAIFLNTGAIRHIGPNRLWVAAARQWAAAGGPALRVDMIGIGEGSGRDVAIDLDALYDESRYEQLRAALDHAESRWPGRRIVAVGICSGAYWSFRAALADGRIAEAVLLNPGVLVWDPNSPSLEVSEEQLIAARFRDLVRRCARREVGPGTLLRLGGAAVKAMPSVPGRVLGRIRERLSRPRVARSIKADIERVAPDTGLVLAFSGAEAVHQQLVRLGVLEWVRERPNVTLVDLPGQSHTLAPVVAQRAALTLIAEVQARHPGSA